MKRIKILICIAFLFGNTRQLVAQCDEADNSTISIGSVTYTDSYCPASGTIQLGNVTGGGGEYIYEITAGPVVRIIQSQDFFNALPGGTYTVRVSSCKGQIKDTSVTIQSFYNAIYSYYWEQSISKQSGLMCGNTNDGVYKLSKPSYTGGTAPFRFQISATSNFAAVPFEPGFDSALFTGLSASTAYYVRITDACNNFITISFNTPPPAPVEPLMVPALLFQRQWMWTTCTGNEMIRMHFRDSATFGEYDVRKTFTNNVFWGNKPNPHIRIRVEDVNSGTVYTDRNLKLVKYGDWYSWVTDTQEDGETGLPAPGVGSLFYGGAEYPNNIAYTYPNFEFPAYHDVKVTMFFPGGNYCGTVIPPYSREFIAYPGAVDNRPPQITSIQSSCSPWGSTMIRANLVRPYFWGDVKLVKLDPSYTVLSTSGAYTGNGTLDIYYSSFITGERYRVIISDTCGRTDSMDMVYSPGGAPVGPPDISDTIKVNYKCPANPADTIYSIIIQPLPAGYSLSSVSVAGYGNVYYSYLNNWNNTTGTAFELYQRFPPGTYTYTLVWSKDCSSGTITKTITILPDPNPPAYRAGINLSLFTSVRNCYTDGYQAIKVSAYVKNMNTGYTLGNLRIYAAPNNHVFPIQDLYGVNLNSYADYINAYYQHTGDSLSTYSDYAGIKINTGQEGTYTIAIDVLCPDGSVLETLTKTILVNATVPIVPARPVLKFASALTCDPDGSELKINMGIQGGTAPFFYEYKLSTSGVYIPTPNGGTDNIISINPAPAPGTIYDLRVTDACGNSASNKVSVGSLTGQFYIYQYPVDCYNSPFTVRVGTAYINGAYYTWKRNGVVIAQGYNLNFQIITGVSVDLITVDINVYDCYMRSASRTIVSANPCGIIILPVHSLDFTGNRISSSTVKLEWKSDLSQNLSHFELEKSSDGTHFRYTGGVKAGYGAGQQSYVYNDPDTSMLLFYRLKSVDKFAKETYSKVIKIISKRMAVVSMSIMPNPARDNVTVKITTDKAITFKLRIFDGKGQLVREIIVQPNEISGKKIDLTSLADGSYFISLTDNWEVISSARFIKQ